MFGIIKDFFFKKELEEARKNVIHSIHILPFEDAKYIGLIVNGILIDKNLCDLQSIIQLLENAHKTYCIIAICDEKKFPELLKATPHIIVSQKQLNAARVPSEKIIKKLKNENFDILIDLNQGNNKTAFFLSAITKSQIHIGAASQEREPFCDMMIEWRSSDNAFQFVQHIIYYLGMFTKQADTV